MIAFGVGGGQNTFMHDSARWCTRAAGLGSVLGEISTAVEATKGWNGVNGIKHMNDQTHECV